MKWHSGWTCFALVLIAAICAGCASSKRREKEQELSLGIAAYQNGPQSEAVRHLENAVALDPDDPTTHYYLALVYSDMYGAGISSEGEERFAARATQEYQRTLEISPNHRDALKGFGYLLYWRAKFEDAEHTYRRALQVDPNDPETLYTLGHINFRAVYVTRVTRRVDLKLSRKQTLIFSPACREVRDKNLARVEEGIELLNRAIRQTHDVDAETMLSVFYLERADIQCADGPAYERDRRSAQEWRHQACETFRRQGQQTRRRPWFPPPPPPPPGPGDQCAWWW